MWSAVRRGDAATVRERLAAGAVVDEADGEGGGALSHPAPMGSNAGRSVLSPCLGALLVTHLHGRLLLRPTCTVRGGQNGSTALHGVRASFVGCSGSIVCPSEKSY